MLVSSQGGDGGQGLPTVSIMSILEIQVVEVLVSSIPWSLRSQARYSLDHVADDTVGFSWTGVVGRDTVPEHLQGGVTGDSVLST